MPVGFRVMPGMGEFMGIFRVDPRANNIGVIPAKAGIQEVLQKLQNAGFPLSQE
jgi:hypothetical protein